MKTQLQKRLSILFMLMMGTFLMVCAQTDHEILLRLGMSDASSTVTANISLPRSVRLTTSQGGESTAVVTPLFVTGNETVLEANLQFSKSGVYQIDVNVNRTSTVARETVNGSFAHISCNIPLDLSSDQTDVLIWITKVY